MAGAVSAKGRDLDIILPLELPIMVLREMKSLH